MLVEAKIYHLFMFLFTLIGTTVVLFMWYFMGIMFPTPGEFKWFVLILGAVAIGQVVVFLVLALKSKANEHLLRDGTECETELLQIVDANGRNSGMYVFYVKCRYKNLMGEYKEVKSSKRFVMVTSYMKASKTPEGFTCVPKVYVDRENENKYYVSVQVKK